eukprot:7494763-Alexandrium_andersonii.AAC.1
MLRGGSAELSGTLRIFPKALQRLVSCSSELSGALRSSPELRASRSSHEFLAALRSPPGLHYGALRRLQTGHGDG